LATVSEIDVEDLMYISRHRLLPKFDYYNKSVEEAVPTQNFEKCEKTHFMLPADYKAPGQIRLVGKFILFFFFFFFFFLLFYYFFEIAFKLLFVLQTKFDEARSSNQCIEGRNIVFYVLPFSSRLHSAAGCSRAVSVLLESIYL
jgi:hypothetical protein